MSFFQQSILTSPGSKFDERLWVAKIRKTLDEEMDEENEIPVTIFGVPKALMASDPDSYTPHLVAIGPYHHLRLELYDMERYKVAAAKRIQRELHTVKLQSLVDLLINHDLRIRASYHRPVPFGPEALAWIMAVDACFIFEFLRCNNNNKKKKKILSKIPSGLCHLIDSSRKKTSHNSILRDLLMLENQIPLFVMSMLFELHFSSEEIEIADQKLLAVLTSVSNDLSPFKAAEKMETVAVSEHAHLLDFLYNFIVPKAVTSFPTCHEIEFLPGGDDEEEDTERLTAAEAFAKPTHLRRLVDMGWAMLSKLKFTKPLKLVVKLPWTILTKIPILKVIKEPVEKVLRTAKIEKKKDEEDEESSLGEDKPPLQEEIAIPSVTQLAEAGVQFAATNEGISGVRFDSKTLTFHIPVISLDVNSEVVLRNLVAYEACSASGPLVLARYVELMNGIINTEADAKFLCGRGIIVNHLKSEKEVADLWNGMSKSVRLTKVASLDAVIADANRFYSKRWKVRMGKLMREYVFGSWKILTFVAATAMLILMILQAFCQVYSCSRVLPIEALEPLDPNGNN